jgi:hypothetical protein
MTQPNIYEVKITVIMPFWSDQESPIDLIHDALGISDLEIISYEDQRNEANIRKFVCWNRWIRYGHGAGWMEM